MKRIIIAALLTCLVSPALGMEDTGRYYVLGHGGDSCGSWTAEKNKKSPKYIIYGVWTDGFITSYNFHQPGLYDVAKGTDTAGRTAWIDNFCAANPLTSISRATGALIRFLKDR